MALRSSVSLVLPARSLCCHIRTAATAMVTYYLVSTILVLVDMVSAVINGRDLCGFVHSEHLTHSQRIFDITSNLLLVAVMIISSVFALVSLWKRSAHQLVPFIVLLFLDAALTLMSLFSSQWGLPGTPSFEQGHKIMELLSSEKGKELTPAEMAHLTMIFSVFFILYLLMKVYMAQTVLHYYFVMKAQAQAQKSTRDEKSVSVDLPSYDEVLKLPSKARLPAYQEA
ncbi:mtp family protein [Scleropages formosus]|uniref:Lysosomal protein transmembrane 5 n=1 Tax=Scleropages formosus TaxID=113540 RepID=A0A8C9SHW0_SCLFO|nr:lysosomal-associated transmembrane protein 5 [Scleropages formosus]